MRESDDCLLILRHKWYYLPLHNGDNNDNNAVPIAKCFPLHNLLKLSWKLRFINLGKYFSPRRICHRSLCSCLTFLGHPSHQLTFSLLMSRRNVILLGQKRPIYYCVSTGMYYMYYKHR